MVGQRAAEEDSEKIYEALKDADMIFITAGMGGGTGSGAAHVIAEIAKDLGALTVGVITKPFSFEGVRRKLVAEQFSELLKEKCDTLITIPNDRLREVVDKKTSILDAFRVVDDVLRQGVQGISDLITVPGLINLDFADVKTIMRDAGSSMMGIGIGTGDNRAVEAARAAVMSPLLEVNITGARGILFNVTGGSDLGLFEVNEAAEVIKEAADPEANIIFGTVIDDRMRDEVKVTVIATGFDATRKPRPTSRAVTGAAVRSPRGSRHRSTSAAARSWPRSSAIAPSARRSRTRCPRRRPSPAAEKPAEPASRSSDRQPIPVRGAGLDRPTYGETDLDIPSFLRRKSE